MSERAMIFEIIHHHRTDLGTLRIHADCAELDRCYELESYDGAEWRVIAWWASDFGPIEGLPPALEDHEVTRWAECDPLVDALWQAHVARERFAAVAEYVREE